MMAVTRRDPPVGHLPLLLEGQDGRLRVIAGVALKIVNESRSGGLMMVRQERACGLGSLVVLEEDGRLMIGAPAAVGPPPMRLSLALPSH